MSELIPGLKEAIRIVEIRVATSKILKYNDAYMGAYEDALVFLRAELWRQENPKQVEDSNTVGMAPPEYSCIECGKIISENKWHSNLRTCSIECKSIVDDRKDW